MAANASPSTGPAAGLTTPAVSTARAAAPTTAALAAHRFGLGEASLEGIGSDAAGWLLAQVAPAPPQRGEDLPSLSDSLRHYARFLQAQQELRRRNPDAAMADTRSTEQQFVEHFRKTVQGDVRARLVTAALTPRPFAERLAWFWANHFTVSIAKASARGLAGPFEREAIRPHIAGTFEQLLKKAVKHGSMIRYLDNELSAGPRSRVVARRAMLGGLGGNGLPRITGLNENLAREVLELHTLGAASHAYTQADVTAFAAVLTGWRAPYRLLGENGTQFDAAWHEPGPKTVLGKTYPEGEAALDTVLGDLARHEATMRFVSGKLARHFVADEPPGELVEALVTTWRRTDGDLPSLYRTLVTSPWAWAPTLTKLKSPEEFVVSTVRLLQMGEQAFSRVPDGSISTLGQRVQAAPSPAGWPDRAEEWLGPDAVWKRVEWATRVADRLGRNADARDLAERALGPLLSEGTRQQIERANDGPQALALLLLAPEFQRR